MITHQPYPSDVSDAEWEFVVPYLCLLPEDAGQRVYNLRDVFDGLRWIVRTGSPWRYLPKDFPPWEMVYQQSRRWLAAGCFEAIVHDLRAILRFAAGKQPEPTAAVFDGRTVQSTPESGGRAGYDGYKRRKGSKVHMAVDTLGHLLALHVTPANEQERDQVAVLAEKVQEVTGESVEIAFVDQGYTGDDPDADAASYGIHLVVVSLPEAKKGFVLLPKRWVVERSYGWMARFRRLARDYERLSETLKGLHYVAQEFHGGSNYSAPDHLWERNRGTPGVTTSPRRLDIPSAARTGRLSGCCRRSPPGTQPCCSSLSLSVSPVAPRCRS